VKSFIYLTFINHTITCPLFLGLELSQDEVALIYGWLIVVTQRYETSNHSYQETTSRLSASLKQLKVELDCHRGTKDQLARAAAKLIAARDDAVNSAMEVEEAKKQLFETTADIIAANDDIEVLQGLYHHHDCQDEIMRNTDGDR
jgi:recombinational DNA repair ATPase RecF